MSRPSVCFVIPYYNVGVGYLSRAVESIRGIGDCADWEVLVVDDGSVGCEARDYVDGLCDDRVVYRYVSHCGLGGARNVGIDLTDKEYIQFVDADDCLFVDGVSGVLEVISRYRPDVVCFGYRYLRDGLDGGLGVCRGVGLRGVGGVVCYESGADYLLSCGLRVVGCWLYVFRREVLGGLRFTPGIFHEDEEFSSLLFAVSGRVCVTDLCVYGYCRRVGSIVRRRDVVTLDKRFSDLLSIVGRLRCLSSGDYDVKQLRAIGRRVDEICMVTVFTLLRDAPDGAFVRRWLGVFRSAGVYPIVGRRYSFFYRFVRLVTLCECCAVFVSWFLRRSRIVRV